MSKFHVNITEFSPSPLAGEGWGEGVRAGRKQQHGFTLVEIIIALALTALILASLSAALYGLSQGFTHATQRSEREDTINRVSLALQQAIEQARYIEPPNGAQAFHSLLGGAGNLDWLAYLPESSPLAGLYHWHLEPQEGELLLTLTPWIEPKNADNPEPPASLPPHQVINGLTAFSLSYQNAKTGEWTDQWDGLLLPARIRLDMSTQNSGAWPPIIVRLEP
jgi:general secretion pathway protein J